MLCAPLQEALVSSSPAHASPSLRARPSHLGNPHACGFMLAGSASVLSTAPPLQHEKTRPACRLVGSRDHWACRPARTTAAHGISACARHFAKHQVLRPVCMDHFSLVCSHVSIGLLLLKGTFSTRLVLLSYFLYLSVSPTLFFFSFLVSFCFPLVK